MLNALYFYGTQLNRSCKTDAVQWVADFDQFLSSINGELKGPSVRYQARMKTQQIVRDLNEPLRSGALVFLSKSLLQKWIDVVVSSLPHSKTVKLWLLALFALGSLISKSSGDCELIYINSRALLCISPFQIGNLLAQTGAKPTIKSVKDFSLNPFLLPYFLLSGKLLQQLLLNSATDKLKFRQLACHAFDQFPILNPAHIYTFTHHPLDSFPLTRAIFQLQFWEEY